MCHHSTDNSCSAAAALLSRPHFRYHHCIAHGCSVHALLISSLEYGFHMSTTGTRFGDGCLSVAWTRADGPAATHRTTHSTSTTHRDDPPSATSTPQTSHSLPRLAVFPSTLLSLTVRLLPPPPHTRHPPPPTSPTARHRPHLRSTTRLLPSGCAVCAASGCS